MQPMQELRVGGVMRDISQRTVGLLGGFLCGVGRCIQMLMLFVCEQISEKRGLKYSDK